MEAGRPDAAVAAFDQAIALEPNAVGLHANRGLALRMAQRPVEAAESLRAAIRLVPDPKLVLMLATCELMAGQYADGWRHYVGRRDPTTRFDRGGFTRPEWTGAESVSGKRVLVHAEQGLGDTIMFSRYLALLHDRNAEVLFAPQTALRPLMQSIKGGVRIVDAEIDNDAFDLHARLLTLPMAFGTTLQTTPRDVPYLSAEPARSAAWRERLRGPGLKVGVTWRSSPAGVKAGRAFAPEMLATLGASQEVRFISLQKPDAEFPAERQRALGLELPLQGFDADGAFLDTAAMIDCCDLVIACDGAVANLAGALGRPVWIALPFSADWRWLTGRVDSPWYPTARLFRQPAIGNWTAVMRDLSEALNAKKAPSRS